MSMNFSLLTQSLVFPKKHPEDYVQSEILFMKLVKKGKLTVINDMVQ